MQHRITRNALSVFLAFVLVFTSNNATFQPLVALANEATAIEHVDEHTETPEGALADVNTSANDTATEQPAKDVLDVAEVTEKHSDGIDADKSPMSEGSEGEPNAEEQVVAPQESPEPRDISDNTDALDMALRGIAYSDADGVEVLVETIDNRVDISGINAASVSGMHLVYRLTIDPRTLHVGDFFMVRAPQVSLTLASEDKLIAANVDSAAQVTYSIVEDNVRVMLTAQAVDTTKAFELEVRVPVELADDALGEESVEVKVPLQDETSSTVVLPAREIEEKSTTDEAVAEVPLAVSTIAPKAATTDVVLDKYWADNNDVNRPNDGLVDALFVSFSLDGGTTYTKLADSNKSQLGLDAIPRITASIEGTGTNRTVYTCSNLPTIDKEGKPVTYKIDEDPAKALELGYLQQFDGGRLYNVKTTLFTAKVTVRDGENYKDPGNVFTLFQADGTPVDTLTATWNFDAATGAGTYTVADLPMYDLSGNQIAYYAKISEPADITKDYYLPEYDNTAVPNHGTDIEKCFDGGTINLTLAGEAVYEGTKVWLDNGADVVDRPDATFFLWRYTDKNRNGFAQASQVRDDKNTPIAVVLAGDDKKAGTFNFTVVSGKTPNLKSLPKYDAEGYPYVYLTREMLLGDNAGAYEQVFGVVTEGLDGSFITVDTLPDGVSRNGADKSLYNGGTLSNRLTGNITLDQKKTWKASIYQNQIEDVKVTLSLQSKPKNDASVEWKDTGIRQTLEGFKAEIMTLTASQSASAYDELGRELEYQWVETSIKQGTSDEELLKKDEAGNLTFELACNKTAVNLDPTAPEYFTSTIEPIDGVDSSKGEWIVNRLAGTVDYTIDKTWKQTDGTYGKIAPESGASITVGIFQNGVLFQHYTMDGVVDADNHEVDSYKIYVNDLPKYDNEGRVYSYIAEEVTGYKDWFSSYTQDAEKRITTIKNDPTGPGNRIRVQKEWIDDSDVDHRYPVTVQLHKRNMDGTAGEVVGGPVELNQTNNWWTWVGVDEGTSYKDYVLQEVSLTKNDSTKYTPASDRGPLTVTTDHHIYLVTTGQNDALKMLTVTNKRIGTIDLTVTKTWLDEGAGVGDRPDAALKLVCDEYPDAVVEDPATHTGKVMLPESGELPILDSNGNPISSQQKVETSSKSGESVSYYFHNLPKYDAQGKVVHYSVSEVLENETDFSSKDYVLSITPGAYVIGGIHTDDTQAIAVTNKRAATKNVEFHKLWKDAYAYKNGKRPDIYLKLWETTDPTGAGSFSLVDKTGYKDYQWTARLGADGNPLDVTNQWTAVIKNVPKYNENGKEIFYFAQELTNGNEKAFDYIPVSYEGTAAKVDGSTEDNALKENGTFTNAIENKVTIEGKKFWKGIPAGFPSLQLPKITVRLGQSLTEVEMPTEVASLTGLSTPKDTNDFTFAISKQGTNNPETGKVLPKYTDKGELYVYKVKEEVEGKPAVSSLEWADLYTLGGTAFTLENIYKTDKDNTGSLKIVKTWDRSGDTRSYPVATFKLHRQFLQDTPSETIDEVIDTKTLVSTSDIEEVTFDTLLVYAPDGQAYKYWVEEEGLAGFTENTSVTKDTPSALSVAGITQVDVKNTYDKKDTITLSGTKAWDDYNNAFNQRPGDITLELHRWADAQAGQSNNIPDGVVSVDDSVVKLAWDKTDTNTWKYVYTGLERYAPNGTAWKYKVIEKQNDNLAPYGYGPGAADRTVSALSTNPSNGYITMNELTNTLSTKATVVKEWDDGDDQYKLRPTNVTVKLQVRAGGTGTWQDASTVFETTIGVDTFNAVELNETNHWTHTYSKLPSANGTTPYSYRFVETMIGGEAISTERVDDLGNYNLTENHTYTPSQRVDGEKTTITNAMDGAGKTSLSVEKLWVGDSNDAYNTRPQKIGTDAGAWEISLLLQRSTDKDDIASWDSVFDADGSPVTLLLSGGKTESSASVTFENLPKYKPADKDNPVKEYYYRVVEVEDSSKGYTPDYRYDNDGLNKTVITNTLKTVEVKGTKAWSDDSNVGHNRPSEVQFALYRESKNVSKEEIKTVPNLTWTGKDTNTWTFVYDNVLPELDPLGEAYNYTVVETPVPEGYWASYSADKLKITNTQTKFKLEKVAEATSNPINDVELSVYSASDTAFGTPLATWSRDASGTVSLIVKGASMDVGAGNEIIGLPQGDYVLKETKTPAAYVTATDIPFTIGADGNLTSTKADTVSGSTLTMKDRLAKAHVTLTKSIEGGKAGAVKGIEFSLYKKGAPAVDDKLLGEHLTTDDTGTWNSKDVFGDGLEVGQYYFVETKATDDTELNAQHWEFEITNAADGAVVSATATNASFAASLTLNKFDDVSGNPLPGATFELAYTPEGGGAVRTIPLTGTNGIYSVTDLKKGSYVLTETTLPQGYKDVFSATFQLTDVDNGRNVEVKKGTADPTDVVVSKTSGTWNEKGVTNTRILGSVSLTKVAIGTNTGLAGAEFKLTGPSKEGIYKTGPDGTLSVTDLTWGDYTITETKAPAGYHLGEPYSQPFTIGEDNAEAGVSLDPIENQPNNIKIEKIDNLDTPNQVSGANLKLAGEFADGTSMQGWPSDGTWKELNSLLIASETYTLSEEGAVTGYASLPGNIVFTITNEGKIAFTEDGNPTYTDGTLAAKLADDGVALSVCNMRLSGTVKLSKVDVSNRNEPLNNVVFGLFNDDNDTKIGEFTTGKTFASATDIEGKAADKGSLSIAGLEWGNYYLQELSADGYMIPDTQLSFVINATTTNMTVDFNEVANRQTNVSFTKVDDADPANYVAGAKLKLTGTFANPAVEEISWDSTTGAYNLAGRLVAGQTYKLSETGRLDGYLALSGPITFTMGNDGKLTINQNQTLIDGKDAAVVTDGTSLSLRNIKIVGSAELVKKDASGNPLEGISFELHKGTDGKGGLVGDSLATNADGKIVVSNLFEGDYSFVETATKDDLLLDSTPVPVSIGPDQYEGTATVAMKNAPFAASLEFAKLDGTTGELLTGAKFTLAYTPTSGGQKVNSVLTSTDGTFKVSNLKKGSYVLKETDVPIGYGDVFEAKFTLTDTDNGKTVEFKEGASAVTKTAGTWSAKGVTNTRFLGSLSLTKLDAATKKLLKGAEFTLSDPDNKKTSYITDDYGRINVSNLAWGTYTLTETKAPDGYMLGATPWTKTFQVGPLAGEVKLAWDLGNVENAATKTSITKVDDAAQPVKGAKLILEGTFTNTAETKLAWESAEAPWVLEDQLIAGNEYTLSEMGRVSGYLALGDKTIKFKMGNDSKITITHNQTLADGKPAASVSPDGLVLSLRNIKIGGDVELIKLDENKATLAGVTFSLFTEGSADPLYKNLVTDDNGKIKVEGLAEGSYYFVETATLDGKVLDPTPLPFTIGEGDHAKVQALEMSNDAFRAAVSLTKVDATSGEVLAGTQFSLSKQKAADEFVPVGDPIGTNENGAVSFPLTEKGTYRVQETAAATGYELDTNNPYTAEFTVDNTADFQGKMIELSESVDQETMTKYGLSVENVLYKDGKVANERKLGSVVLKKVDADTGAGLNGVEFSLFAIDNPKQALGLFTTGNAYATPSADASAADDGMLSIAGLAWGDYYLQETKADGYQLMSDKFEFTVEASNAGSAPSKDLGTIGNVPMEFSFTKLELFAESCSSADLGADDANATRPLAGAEFTVFEDEACALVTQSAVGADLVAISDDTGKVAFSHVKAGTYYVKETVVPDKHLQNDTAYQLVVREDGGIERFSSTAEQAGVLTQIVNDVLRTDIRIKKVSETDEGKTLPNSTYGLYKRASAQDSPLMRSVMLLAADASVEGPLQLVAKATTDEDGYLVFEGILMDQSYVIKELVAPEGSLVSKNPITIEFAVDSDGRAKVIKFDDGSGTAEVDKDGNIVWKEPQVTVRIDKKNPEGELLAGAKLQIVDSEGRTVVEPWISSADRGHVVEGVLIAGETYRLQELEAPSGYMVANEVAFVVENPEIAPGEAHVQFVEMIDQRAVSTSLPADVPKGGSPAQVLSQHPSALVRTGDSLALLVGALGGVAVCAAGVVGMFASKYRRKER